MYKAITNQDNEIYVTDTNEMLTLDVLTKKDLDLALETMVVDGTYSDRQLHLILQNGNTRDVDISDIISGLVPDSRKINGKELTTDITLTPGDLGIDASSYAVCTYSSSDPSPKDSPKRSGGLWYSSTSDNLFWSDGKLYNFDIVTGETEYFWNKILKETRINHILQTGEVTEQIYPNVYYKFEDANISSLNIVLIEEGTNKLNEYMFEFTASATPTTLGLPDAVTWIGGSAPTITAGKTYQVSIVNNLAVYGEF